MMKAYLIESLPTDATEEELRAAGYSEEGGHNVTVEQAALRGGRLRRE